MKKFYLIIVLSFLVYFAMGQQSNTTTKKISSDIFSLDLDLNMSKFLKTNWELYVKYNTYEYAPIKAEDVIQDVDRYLTNASTENDSTMEITQYKLIKKYRNNFGLLFQGLGLIGSDQLGEFFYNKEHSLPINFSHYGDKENDSDSDITLLINGVFIDNIYNTIRLTSRQRAALVLTNYILSSLHNFTDNFQDSEIAYFGMTCLYGSKDLTDDSSTSSEFIAFIAPTNLIKEYVSGDLTEEALIKASDVYISDRDMIATIKKIEVTLE